MLRSRCAKRSIWSCMHANLAIPINSYLVWVWVVLLRRAHHAGLHAMDQSGLER